MIKRSLVLLLGPTLVALVSLGIYLKGGRHVITENAYLKSEISTVSSEISGKVLQVLVDDNERVNRGDLLVSLADEPFLIPVARAEANLANIHAELSGLKAEYQNKVLEVASVETDLEYRQLELRRMQQLMEEGSVSIAQFDQADFAVKSVANELETRIQAVTVISSRLINPDREVENHPRYQQALADLHNAKLELSYSEVTAPSDGVVTNLSAHEGENILAGTNLLNLVDDKNLWIEANFKETDLTHVRVNQKVSISIDTYPDVEWKGQVESITPATGSEFALLPAQNSSGNWVKVVQRIMVKINFDDLEYPLPLAAGMSASVSIDTQHIRSLPWLNTELADFVRELW